ncbi:unnamed protein product [Amoebophrya sp. A25]|nr:unnamed protein product [Amoebophrya sp. A25]|eukprot:GSA25T00004191001.1
MGVVDGFRGGLIAGTTAASGSTMKTSPDKMEQPCDTRSDSLYPVAVLIDELRSDLLQPRLKAVQSLRTIAVALGPERTREELVPFLAAEIAVDDEDDVLIALSSEIANLLPEIGGCSYAYALLPALEELANKEEPLVRSAATHALKQIAEAMPLDILLGEMSALVHRLASHDWFTNRIAALGLLPTMIRKTADSGASSHLNSSDNFLSAYCRLVKDDTPMVRRAAANALPQIAEAIQFTSNEPLRARRKQTVGELLGLLAEDNQDSVRVLSIGNLLAVHQSLSSSSEFEPSLLLKCVQDQSWRVRYMAAENCAEVCAALGKERFQTQFLKQVYVPLLGDQEPDVKALAVRKLPEVAKVLVHFGNSTPIRRQGEDAKKLEEPDLSNVTETSRALQRELLDSIKELFLEQMVKPEAPLTVRVAVAGSVLATAPVVGEQLTVDPLVKLFLELIRDEASEVRLTLIASLPDLAKVIKVTALKDNLLPALKKLAADRQWRVRLAVLESTTTLAGVLRLVDDFPVWTFNDWLADPVYLVREAASESIAKLTELLGVSWAEEHAVPQIEATLVDNSNYLLRVTAITALARISDKLQQGATKDRLLERIFAMGGDTVPNVRFNVAKVLPSIISGDNSSASVNDARTLLQRLAQDTDPDVKDFAQKSLKG